MKIIVLTTIFILKLQKRTRKRVFLVVF